jgi:hypothetical protein
MMKKLSLSVISLIAALTFVFAPLQTAYADPVDVFKDACSGSSDTTLCKNTSGSGIFGIIRTVIQVMLIIGGIIAVIMIILGGIRYTTSNGDPADVKAAKDTILYAIIGLIISISGYAIVTWVVGNF